MRRVHRQPGPAIQSIADPHLKAMLDDIYGKLQRVQQDVTSVTQVTVAAPPLEGMVDRGDPASADWTQATLTADGNWHDLDCSSIVPAPSRWVLFAGVLHYGELWLRKNGNTNAINVARLIDRNEDVAEDVAGDMLVPCDTSQVVEYKLNSGGGGFALDLTVKGWWV